MTRNAFRENAATIAGRRVVAALEARDFAALAELFAPGYVEIIRREGQAPIPRDQMLHGIRMLVEGGGMLSIEPIATLGERIQLHHTRIRVPTPDAEPNVIHYVSVLQVDGTGRALQTEAFDRLEDAHARLDELRSRP